MYHYNRDIELRFAIYIINIEQSLSEIEKHIDKKEQSFLNYKKNNTINDENQKMLY